MIVDAEKWLVDEGVIGHQSGGSSMRDRQLIESLTDMLDLARAEAATAHVRVGVATIIRKGNSVLMGRRKGSHGAGKWSFPGGHLDKGESPLRAAVRELEEETGLKYEPAGLIKLTFTNDVFEVEGKHYITLYYETGYQAPYEPVIKEPDKCSEWRWWEKPPPMDELFLPVRNLLMAAFPVWR